MTAADSRSMVQVLRARLDGEDGDRNGQWLAEYVIEKAISGHFGFFKLLIDLVDGKVHQTAEDERSFETGCVLVVADDEQGAETSKAA